MKISCSPSFVTAIYSLLEVLNLSKQELGGTGQFFICGFTSAGGFASGSLFLVTLSLYGGAWI